MRFSLSANPGAPQVRRDLGPADGTLSYEAPLARQPTQAAGLQP
jgi:hypothetical protein